MEHTIFQYKKVLITAGPTQEAIDPVRYISNHSSGKMGYAIAEAFLQQEAEVILISGPVSMDLKHPRLKLHKVNSAAEMYLMCCRYFEEVDIAVFAAAVADYRPAVVSEHKIKKTGDDLIIRMLKNVDIAYEFGQAKKDNQLSIGFALETNDELVHAKGKLDKKKFDFVVLNSMNDDNATFGHDTNKIKIVKNDLSSINYSLKSKKDVAADIINEAAAVFALKEISLISNIAVV